MPAEIERNTAPRGTYSDYAVICSPAGTAVRVDDCGRYSLPVLSSVLLPCFQASVAGKNDQNRSSTGKFTASALLLRAKESSTIVHRFLNPAAPSGAARYFTPTPTPD